MNKRSIIAVGMCLGSLLGIGFAQMVDVVTVTLPFAATVGKVTLPAGEYTIRDVKENGSGSVLEFRSADGAGVFASVTHISVPNDRTASQTSVVLRHEGNKYQVDKVWLAGRNFGYDLHPASAQE